MNTQSPSVARDQSVVDRYLPTPAGPGPGGTVTTLLSFDSIRAILWRQRLILLGVTVLVILAALVFTLLTTPIYQATGMVQVDTEPTQVVEGQDLVNSYIHPSQLSTYLRTQTTVIQSRDMAERVYESLSPEVRTRVVGSGVEGPEGSARDNALRLAGIGTLRGGLVTDLPLDTQIISIGFQSPDSVLAAMVANAYIEEYLTDEIARTVEASSYAREYLEEQIDQVRMQLRDAEIEANQYARANRIIAQPLADSGDGDSAAGTAPTLAASNVIDVNSTYNQARAKRIEAEQRWRSVANLPPSRLAEVQQDPGVQSLRAQLAQLTARQADLRQRYRDDYPEVQELASQIDVLENRLAVAGSEIKSTIQNDYQIALRQERALRSELGTVSEASLDEQDGRVQLGLLDRQVDSLQTQLAALMNRYNDISVAANLRTNSVTLLDRATVPGTPTSPDLLKNLFVALVVGLGLAVLVAILRETLDDRIRSLDDVRAKLGVHTLGQSPFVPDNIGNEIDNVFSPIGEAHSSLRASIEYALGDIRHPVVLFTSTLPGEGKTTTVTALAQKFAAAGRKTLLIDFDFRRPAVHKQFAERKPDQGIVDLLHGRANAADVMAKQDLPNLDVLPVGKIPADPVELLSSGLVAEFLDRTRMQYDIVLLDSPPVIGIADAPLLARHAHATVMVVEANRTKPREVLGAINRIREGTGNVLGAVVTKYRSLEAGQGYSYGYQYYTYNSDQ